jgi:hypothetical protein
MIKDLLISLHIAFLIMIMIMMLLVVVEGLYR